MGAKKFTDLIVWQKAYTLSERIRQVTEAFPPKEGRLVDQMRSSSSSIPENIAEGFGRWTPNDQPHFYTIAKGSAEELKVQLMQSERWGFCPGARELLALADEVCAMLYRLRQKVLERKPRS